MSALVLPAVIALGAAAGYAAGAVLQQRGAFGPGAAGSSGAAMPVTAMFRRPIWLAGLGLDGVGFMLEFLALRASSVTLVQPLLVCGLLFALPLGALLARTRIRKTDLGAGALVVLGLVLFLIAARPVEGSAVVPVGRWVGVVGVSGGIVGVLLLLSRGRRAALRAVLLGAAAGVVNGVFAGLAKAVSSVLERGWAAMLGSWQPVALAVAAVLTLTLAAKAFQVGSPAAAVTGLFAVEPVAGIAVGTSVFGDTIAVTPLLLSAEVVGMVLAVGGVILLARSPAVLAVYAAPPEGARLPAAAHTESSELTRTERSP